MQKLFNCNLFIAVVKIYILYILYGVTVVYSKYIYLLCKQRLQLRILRFFI